jgi:hypothetical protein
MRELAVKYTDELTGAIVHLRVKIVCERDGVVAQGLDARSVGIAKARAVAAVVRRLDTMQDEAASAGRDEEEA